MSLIKLYYNIIIITHKYEYTISFEDTNKKLHNSKGKYPKSKIHNPKLSIS